ncbi:hypothetical protein GCM10022419_103250 [Nonomuraea rosea]|uniref:Protein kinase domain-containing protein n=1 Tax=Nonomuraea rosea TaxID=638574 RepID=A0ABP6ZB68_9ACTN
MQGVRPLRPGDPASVGPYEVVGFLGEGGQGSVYLGVSPSGEQVAIKLLHARFAEDEQAVRRFRREAEAARRVAEFCTARVLEVGTVHDQPYIVGEYVDGPSLQDHVAKDGPVRGASLMRLAITTATALVAIHGAGVVHRDFKPNNVLLGPDGPRVIDFGIARALDLSQSMTTGIVGTPAFMAPEQFLGEASPASDVFAWAGTMVFAATGRGAFGQGALPVVMHRILNLDPDLSGVPGELAPLLWASLAKDHRYRPTAEQLIRDLIRAGTAPPPPAPGPAGGSGAHPARSGAGSGPHPAGDGAGSGPHPARSGSGSGPHPAGGGAQGHSAERAGAHPRTHDRARTPWPGSAPSPQAGNGPSPHAGAGSRPWAPAGMGTPGPVGVATVPPVKRLRKALVPVGAAVTALTVGAAIWLVLQADPPFVPSPKPTSTATQAAGGFGAAVAAVANPSAKRGGTLRMVSTASLESTDPGNMYLPVSVNLVRLYGRSLTMFKPAPGAEGTKVVPDLAEALGVPGDGGKTWTYKLRQGVKYQDGTSISSKDVKHAVLRSMDEGLANGSSYFDLLLDLPTGYKGAHKSPNANTDSAITTPDDRTIVFHLKAPYAAFDQVVQLPETVPVPAAKDTGDKYGGDVVSSGPYKLESVTDTKVMLVRNDQWDVATDPNRKPLPDRYEVEYGVPAAEATKRLTGSTADVGPSLLPEETPSVLGDPALRKRADEPLTTTVRMLAINPEVPPFDNADCRRAVVQALDLNALRAAYGTDRQQAPTSLLPPTITGRHEPDPNLKPGGDPALARKSLQACGHPNGFAATYVYRDLAAETRAAEIVQDSLHKVGIEIKLERVPIVEFHRSYGGSPDYLKEHKVGLIAKSWAPDWPDPESFLSSLVDSRQINEKEYSINVSVRDPRIDALIDQAKAELDPTRRAGKWSEVESMVAEEAVLVPLAWQSPLLLRGQRVTNVHVSPIFGTYDLLTMGVTP